MSTQGIILIDLAGLGMIFLILNLVRTKKLHVGYAAVWFLTIMGMMLIISLPPLLSFLPRLVGAIFPASALSLLAFIFIFLVLIFFSTQLSILSSRQVELIQALALRDLVSLPDVKEPEERPTSKPATESIGDDPLASLHSD